MYCIRQSHVSLQMPLGINRINNNNLQQTVTDHKMLHYKAEMCISVIAAWSNANHCTALLIEQNNVFVTKIQNWCHKCTLQHYCVLAKTDYIKTRNLTMELLEFLMVRGHFFLAFTMYFNLKPNWKRGWNYITLHVSMLSKTHAVCLNDVPLNTVIWLKSLKHFLHAWLYYCMAVEVYSMLNVLLSVLHASVFSIDLIFKCKCFQEKMSDK